MSLEQAKQTWQAGGRTGARALDEASLVRRVRRQASAFERRIRWRDRIESVAILIASAALLPLLLRPEWITRVGVAVVLAAGLFIFLKLRRARRRHGPPDVSAPLADVLRAEQERLDTQIRLLEGVLWWYIVPLCVGLIVVFVGLSGWSTASLLYAAAVVLLGGGIYLLNRRAVARGLRPRREKLQRLLERLDG